MIYDIATEPCGEQYCTFVDYAITHSDAVMLVFSIKEGSKLQGNAMRTIRKQLAQWRIKSRHGAQWPVTTTHDSKRNYTIDLYLPSQAVKNYLLTSNSLYAWGNNDTPGDIAFFRKNQCWIATCSHEEFGWINLEEEPQASFMQCLKKIPHPNDVTYYESYKF